MFDQNFKINLFEKANNSIKYQIYLTLFLQILQKLTCIRIWHEFKII